jgi:hypothetical protein
MVLHAIGDDQSCETVMVAVESPIVDVRSNQSTNLGRVELNRKKEINKSSFEKERTAPRI